MQHCVNISATDDLPLEVQLSLFPDRVRLRRIDSTQNMRRFYRMHLQPDLFGGCLLVREWGRIGTRGQSRCDLYSDEAQAVMALIALDRAKRRRGYS